jgi:single-strand DNA-binding protein
MSDINCVILFGRLTRDAEIRYIASGQAISKFSLAVDRRVKAGDGWVNEASFFEVEHWGKGAEAIKPYMVKGKQVAVMGELKQDRWTSEGQNRSKVVIVAHNVMLLGGNETRPTMKQDTGSVSIMAGYPPVDYTDDIPF